ncbi:MAG: hypothetical protein AAB487_03105 [Patescibacteria group bacterium]
MFGILKLIVWILVILVAAYFAMGYSGYQVNWDYFKESKKACEQRIKECSESLIRKGIDNVKCDFVCVDRNLIIKKK